jgi:hypothetical protein
MKLFLFFILVIATLCVFNTRRIGPYQWQFWALAAIGTAAAVIGRFA